MKVNTMRYIDKYVGVPLCLLGSIFFKIFLRPKKNIQPKNVLFIELSEMGSAILVDPAMEKTKKVFNANLFFLIFKKNKLSLQLLNTVEDKNIFTINAESIFSLFKDTIKFLMWSRKQKIDTVIDLELFSRYSGLLAGFSGADNIVAFNNFHGEGLYKGSMVTHKVMYNSHMHIAKNFVAMINALLSNNMEIPYSKTAIDDNEIILKKAVINNDTTKSVINRIQNIIPEYSEGDKLILINPNASELLPQRRWDRKNYQELIKKILLEYKDVYVLITGAPSEKDEAQELANQCGDRCYSFAGEVKLVELLSLYSISQIMVTNDSGPAHFAAVTNMPTIVLFGPETPHLYSSLGKTRPVYANLACSPCVSAANHRKTPCNDNVCLQSITVEQVFNVLKEEYEK